MDLRKSGGYQHPAENHMRKPSGDSRDSLRARPRRKVPYAFGNHPTAHGTPGTRLQLLGACPSEARPLSMRRPPTLQRLIFQNSTLLGSKQHSIPSPLHVYMALVEAQLPLPCFTTVPGPWLNLNQQMSRYTYIKGD
jgi:hypothetical protein